MNQSVNKLVNQSNIATLNTKKLIYIQLLKTSKLSKTQGEKLQCNYRLI